MAPNIGSIYHFEKRNATMSYYNNEKQTDESNEFVLKMFEESFTMSDEEKEMITRILNVPMNGEKLIQPLKHNSILQFYLIKHLEKNSLSNDKNSKLMNTLTFVLILWGGLGIIIKLYEIGLITYLIDFVVG